MILYFANSKPTAVLRGSCYPQLYLKNPPPHHFKTSTRTPSTNLFHLWVTRAGPRCKFSFAHHLRRGCVAPDETKLDNRLPTALTDSFSFHLVLAASGLRCVVAVFTCSSSPGRLKTTKSEADAAHRFVHVWVGVLARVLLCAAWALTLTRANLPNTKSRVSAGIESKGSRSKGGVLRGFPPPPSFSAPFFQAAVSTLRLSHLLPPM